MPAVELLFQQSPASNPAELLFGEIESLPGTYSVAVAASLPALALSAYIASSYRVNVDLALPALAVAVQATYDINVQRPLVNKSDSYWQKGDWNPTGAQHVQSKGLDRNAGRQSYWTPARWANTGSQSRHQIAKARSGDLTRTKHAEALQVGNWTILHPQNDGLRNRRQSIRSQFEEGIRVRDEGLLTLFSDMLHGYRPNIVSTFTEAVRLHRRQGERLIAGRQLHINRGSRFQQAMRPPPGISPVIPLPQDPCYIPDPNLLFSGLSAEDGSLIFICERQGGGTPGQTVIVPVRSVYVVINDISLRRVADNMILPALSMSLSIDADSWTWGFSASLPAYALDAVMPDNNGPIELEAKINANLYRIVVEQVSRDRTFGSNTVKIAGRGKNAILAAPYAPTLTFANTQQRTAQQLMGDVLTFNNVPLGWTINWNLDDWLVPAGAFSVQGAYMDGLNAIAGAAGAYIQPHPTLAQLSVNLRYPTPAWQWNSVTPDYELPSAVTVRESIEWIERPSYNRVYVSGTSQGILGQVTRTGSGGTLSAPMVTDPLITASNAARQRGVAVLSDTGRKAKVGLRLPVLEETGVITPGKFIRYVDGLDERIGIVRSVSVDAALAETFQTLEVETQA